MRGAEVKPVVIAAGGTGGHLFPAEALAAELAARGGRPVLMTDARSGGLRSPGFAGREGYVLRGAGLAGRGPLRALAGAAALAAGTAQARAILARIGAAAIVGFGGYPSVAPILGSRLLARRPVVVLHEQNAVLGRANRALARFADALALGAQDTAGLPQGALAGRAATWTGNPVRLEMRALAGQGYAPPEPGGPVHLLVTGGSQGARALSDALPAAVALLPDGLRARLRVTQQCRAEDLERVRAAYAAQGVPAELAAFFEDLAGRLARAHFVVARAGAGTVAELGVAGRPALLVPLPGSIDGHQARNAAASGAAVLEQAAFERDPQALADALAAPLSDPAALVAGAASVARHGRPDAASSLADLVEATVRQPAATQGTQT